MVSVRPRLRVLFTHPLEAGPAQVPLLDWQFVVIRVGGGVSLVDPVLTFARHNTVYFYQVRQPASLGASVLATTRNFHNHCKPTNVQCFDRAEIL